ncbi:MAG: DUF1801 domain-containing protein [Xanthomonadales bacterium]|nr:DUF1801 domain-containing protein [Gammaproteobacteria bacterium]MBT8051779.1 DUF1801 domain-containing protein [Gammaproteobacteria bacterium]MBT8055355.1 DUF1801 domain-containing protein [Gammaproteobacteria bacterium]NNJ79743.1 DUF1801 domain-containing protein [Xanthomonadales bacterium]NNL05295.1 DUF1801 domain-containing protein [Xanthomonadales bacterium]
MTQNKTVQTDTDVEAFIGAVDNERKRRDSRELIEMMRRATGREPKLWGSSLVGFGQYHYRYESGREGDFFLTGFSPRKAALTVYIIPGFTRYEDQLKQLGPHKTGKSCLYIRNLDAVDRKVLEHIVHDSVDFMREHYECR